MVAFGKSTDHCWQLEKVELVDFHLRHQLWVKGQTELHPLCFFYVFQSTLLFILQSFFGVLFPAVHQLTFWQILIRIICAKKKTQQSKDGSNKGSLSCVRTPRQQVQIKVTAGR